MCATFLSYHCRSLACCGQRYQSLLSHRFVLQSLFHRSPLPLVLLPMSSLSARRTAAPATRGGLLIRSLDPPQLLVSVRRRDAHLRGLGLSILVAQRGLRTLAVHMQTMASLEAVRIIGAWHAVPKERRVPCCLLLDESQRATYLALAGHSFGGYIPKPNNYYCVRPGIFARVYCVCVSDTQTQEKSGRSVVTLRLPDDSRRVYGGNTIRAVVLCLRRAPAGESWLTSIRWVRDTFAGGPNASYPCSSTSGGGGGGDNIGERIARAMDGLRTFTIPDK